MSFLDGAQSCDLLFQSARTRDLIRLAATEEQILYLQQALADDQAKAEVPLPSETPLRRTVRPEPAPPVEMLESENEDFPPIRLNQAYDFEDSSEDDSSDEIIL